MSETDVSSVISMFQETFKEIKAENEEMMKKIKAENEEMKSENLKMKKENEKQMSGYKKAINTMIVIVCIFIFGSGGFFYNGINTSSNVKEITAKINIIEKHLIAAGTIEVDETMINE